MTDRNVYPLHRGIAPPKDFADSYRVACGDPGCDYCPPITDLRPTRHIVIEDNAAPSWLERVRAMPVDVPEAVRLVIADIRERPHSHALVALVTFVGTAAAIYGSSWVLVHTVLS